MIRVVLALILIASSRGAIAGTRRVAVVVGNNTGNTGQIPLRFAEVDASKVGRVLTELGGVAPADLYLVQGQRLPQLQSVLAKAAAAITRYQRLGDRVIAIFYFSGHSDGLALELDGDRFTFTALREWLKGTGAEVRLALVDSCKSGALIAAKGGSLGPAFSIRLTDDVSATGEALLTSSASDENALESTEIGGSFFTHHLVSGLRGAADTSLDGRVTLGEAYEYAYKHTITTSGATLAGPQHPTYDYRITGQGELVLTELARPTASLLLPDGIDRGLVIDSANDQVIAELDRGEKAQIALAPGNYGVRVWKDARVMEAHIALVAGEHRAVRWQELHFVTLPDGTAKGGEPSTSSSIEVSLAAGGRTGVADDVHSLLGMRAGIRFLDRYSVTLDANTRRGSTTGRESNVFVFAGYRRGISSGPVRVSLGAVVGVGAIVQTDAETRGSPAAAAGPTLELALAMSPRISFALEVEATATLFELDKSATNKTATINVVPSLWLGTSVRL